MFFAVSLRPDTRFPFHEKLGSLVLSHDAGWICTNDTWTKGYNYTEISHGNYISIQCNNNSVLIKHDLTRSFPLWWDASTVTLTNLPSAGEKIWANTTLQIHENKLIQQQIDVYGEIENTQLTLLQAVDLIVSNFDKKFELLKQNHKNFNKRLFVSGGIDTLTLLSFVKKHRVDCELLDYDHFEFDSFTNKNIESIRTEFWAYNQIHHWQQPTMLLTGSCGDEFSFRGPYAVAMWAAWHNIDLVKLLKSSTGYHVGYFLKEKNQKTFAEFYNDRNKIRDLYKTKDDLVRQILNINANDHQHWHLGNTLTWTPFKDLELTKIILRLPEDEIIKHIIDANINRCVIQKTYPKCLSLLSTTKNSNSREFLDNLFTI